MASVLSFLFLQDKSVFGARQRKLRNLNHFRRDRSSVVEGILRSPRDRLGRGLGLVGWECLKGKHSARA